MPSKVCKGQNIINLQAWNAGAILKILWAAHEKKRPSLDQMDKYILYKEDVEHCTIPPNATWIIRKILETRKALSSVMGSGDFRTN